MATSSGRGAWHYSYFLIPNMAETSLDATNAVMQHSRLIVPVSKAEAAVPLSSVAANQQEDFAGGPIKQQRVPSGGALVYLTRGLGQGRRL